MHKTMRILTAVSLLALALSLPAAAQGVRDGTGPIHVQTPFAYTGTIIDCLRGDGITLATVDSGNVVIYGIGPESFWEEYGGRPAVGETITVTGYAISYNGEVRNIAWTITLGNGDLVTLRDEAGLPLWRTLSRSAGIYSGNGRNGRR